MKASEVGAHILSGAVLETKALDELIPDWKSKDTPIKTKVSTEKLLFYQKTKLTQFQNYLHQLLCIMKIII